MRESKFRAWDRKLKRMFRNRSMTPWDIWATWSNKPRVMEEDRVVWMQYIGLTDLSGQDIYEGDFYQTEAEDGYIGIVPNDHRWSCGCCGVGYGWNIYGWWDGSGEDENGIIVIGNIYENPEYMVDIPDWMSEEFGL